MTPLVSRYNSSGTWKFKQEGTIYELVSNYKAILYGYIFTSCLLLIGGIIIFIFASNKEGMFGLIVGIITSLLVLIIGVTSSLEQKKKKSVFTYDCSRDYAEFNVLGLSFQNAIKNVSFSYEVHCGTSNYPNSELNIIVDDERKNFLSSRGENISIEKFVKEIELIGFKVSKYRHPNV